MTEHMPNGLWERMPTRASVDCQRRFQRFSERQQQIFFKRPRDNLQADWQTGGGLAARHRQRRKPEHVDPAREPCGGDARIHQVRRRFRFHARPIRGAVNGVAGVNRQSMRSKSARNSSTSVLAQPLRVDVVGGRNHPALIKQCQHIGAEIAAPRKIRLVQRRRFRQQDHPSGCIQSFDVGHLHRQHARAQLLGLSRGAVRTASFTSARSMIEVEILRQARCAAPGCATGATRLSHRARAIASNITRASATVCASGPT